MIITVTKNTEEKQVNIPSYLLPLVEEMQEQRALLMQIRDTLHPVVNEQNITDPTL